MQQTRKCSKQPRGDLHNFKLSSIAVIPSWLLLPPVLLDHVRQLDDELSFLVLLAGLKCMFILPPKGSLTAVTENICNSMQARQKNSLLCRPAANIHYWVEEVGPALAALEGFTNQLIVISKMSSTVNTRDNLVDRLCTFSWPLCGQLQDSLYGGRWSPSRPDLAGQPRLVRQSGYCYFASQHLAGCSHAL